MDNPDPLQKGKQKGDSQHEPTKTAEHTEVEMAQGDLDLEEWSQDVEDRVIGRLAKAGWDDWLPPERKVARMEGTNKDDDPKIPDRARGQIEGGSCTGGGGKGEAGGAENPSEDAPSDLRPTPGQGDDHDPPFTGNQYSIPPPPSRHPPFTNTLFPP